MYYNMEFKEFINHSSYLNIQSMREWERERERDGGCDDIVVIVTVDMMNVKIVFHAAECQIKET